MTNLNEGLPCAACCPVKTAGIKNEYGNGDRRIRDGPKRPELPAAPHIPFLIPFIDSLSSNARGMASQNTAMPARYCCRPAHIYDSSLW
jgi:hypothetical protein